MLCENTHGTKFRHLSLDLDELNSDLAELTTMYLFIEDWTNFLNSFDNSSTDFNIFQKKMKWATHDTQLIQGQQEMSRK